MISSFVQVWKSDLDARCTSATEYGARLIALELPGKPPKQAVS